MVKKHSIIKKSRLISAFVAMLLFFALAAVAILLSQQHSITLKHAVSEAEHDAEFLSSILKRYYVNNEFTEIEATMSNWVRDNNLDHDVRLVAKNGYTLFGYKSKKDSTHTRRIEKDISLNGEKILKVILVRDISSVMSDLNELRNNIILISGLLFSVLGVGLWKMLSRMVFVPLEAEIDKRLQAEQELRRSHEELEVNVAVRTAELKSSNQELQEVLGKYQQSEVQMAKLSSAIEQTDDIVTIVSKDGIIEYVNPSLERVTGYSGEEVVGKTPAIFQSGEHTPEFYGELWSTISKGEAFKDVFINRRKDGSLYYEEKTITPIKDKQGNVTNYVATGKDISDRIKVQERLQFMATHDDLTDLPNRTLLRDRLLHAIYKSERDNKKVAVLFLDMDKFKHVNDSLGHIVGDQLLRVIAERIGLCTRKGDTIARLGGDEFTIVMEDIEDIDDVNRIAQKVIQALSESIFIESYELTPSTSIGITIYPDDGDSVDELLKNADIAMYRAKARGGNCYQYFTEDMTAHAVEYLEIQNKLSQALSNDEFEVYYQPRIHVVTEKVCGMEALLRWHSKTMGLVMPDKFIPVLEDSRQIVDVGIWVLKQACEFNQSLIDKGFPAVSVSVNLSARQFRDQKTLDAISVLQEQYGTLSNFLEVEITETLLVENIEMAADIMHQLHHLGVSISVDDFGTGYSSMTYLKRFPIDALKIDRSFVTDTPYDQDDVSIVQAIIALARSLNMRSVAEGVETAEQNRLLKGLGCDEAQGYLFSKPVPADEFVDWLRSTQTQISDLAQ